MLALIELQPSEGTVQMAGRGPFPGRMGTPMDVHCCSQVCGSSVVCWIVMVLNLIVYDLSCFDRRMDLLTARKLCQGVVIDICC